MPKIHCPFHEDTNPSMELYSDGHAYCFVCFKTWRPKEALPYAKVEEKEPDNIAEAIERIQRLPIREVRGLFLPVNEQGYFIVWPDCSYYKFRAFEGTPRYLAPRGHEQPLLWGLRSEGAKGLIIVEGELNALSLGQVAAAVGFDVLSPGSAGNFLSREEEIVHIASQYLRTLIWTDQDTPGIRALWAIAPKLISNQQKLAFINSDTDANDILVNEGAGGLLKLLIDFTEGN